MHVPKLLSKPASRREDRHPPRRARCSSVAKPTRPLKWISLTDCAAVLVRSEDVIVIDLREDSRRAPFPVPTAHVISVKPGELAETLEWLPENRSAIFWGASGLLVFVIETSPCMYGSAPLYVLDFHPAAAEVA